MIYSIVALPIWFIALSFIEVDFEYLWVVILITALILLSILFFLVLYLMELVEPNENDVVMDFFFPYDSKKPFSITNFILITGLSFVLGSIYTFVKAHINFQTNKHAGIEFFGGKRKGSTHRKK